MVKFLDFLIKILPITVTEQFEILVGKWMVFVNVSC